VNMHDSAEMRDESAYGTCQLMVDETVAVAETGVVVEAGVVAGRHENYDHCGAAAVVDAAAIAVLHGSDDGGGDEPAAFAGEC